MKRAFVLAASGLLLAACVGKLALAVNQSVEPTPILPGASVMQEVTVEADGLLGTAVKQAMTEAAAAELNQTQLDTPWQVRDNSDGGNVRLRMFRSVSLSEAQRSLARSASAGFDIGSIEVRADDWVVARHYAVRVVVTPGRNTPAAPPGTNPNDQQLAQALLAGITYDYYLTLPGIVTATNGLPGDKSRLAWHLDLTSSSERVLTAESIYLDWPRILLAVVIAFVAVGGLLLRTRAASPSPVVPPPQA